MSTPPGDGQETPKTPGQDPWSWEDHGSRPEPASPPPPAGPVQPPFSAEPAPAPGLVWDATPGAAGASPTPSAAPSPDADWTAALPDSRAQPEPALEPGWSPPPAEAYPTRFDVAYPERMSRWKTFLRLFLLIPLLFSTAIVAFFLTVGLFIGFMTVFWRKKYPDWLFRGNAGAMGFLARSFAYSVLVTDKFPSFAPEASPVTLEFDQPPSGDLSRWRVMFWKWLLLIPMQIVLQFLSYALWVVSFLAWFAILFTGNYPRGLFGFSVGVQRWYWRMTSYQVSFNDRYPPYALSANAGPASNSSVVINGVIGGLIGAGYTAIIVAAIATANQHETRQVNYARLLAGRAQVSVGFDVASGDEVTLRLNQAFDPGDELIQIIRPARGERIVVIRWTAVNGTGANRTVTADAARLEYRYTDGGKSKTKGEDAEFIGINNVSAPASIGSGGTALIQAVFVIPDDAEPTAIWFHHGFAQGGVKYELR